MARKRSRVYYYNSRGERVYGLHSGVHWSNNQYRIGQYVIVGGLYIFGDCTNICGDVSCIHGDVSRIRGTINKKLYGCVTPICGDVTNITGRAAQLAGDVSGLSGDVSYLSGTCTGIYGTYKSKAPLNLNVLNLTPDDRARGVSMDEAVCRYMLHLLRTGNAEDFKLFTHGNGRKHLPPPVGMTYYCINPEGT